MNNRYYDPSYGIGPFVTVNSHENAAIDALVHDWTAVPKLADIQDPLVPELQYVPTNF